MKQYFRAIGNHVDMIENIIMVHAMKISALALPSSFQLRYKKQ